MDMYFPTSEQMQFVNQWIAVGMFSGVCFGVLPSVANYIWSRFKVLIGGV